MWAVGEFSVKKDGFYLLESHRNLMEFNHCTLENAICFHSPLWNCSWLDRFYLLTNLISGIAYGVTKITDQISCVTGWNMLLYKFNLSSVKGVAACLLIQNLLSCVGVSPYVIAFTALAAGTSWPDLVASKIAAERQITADSAIANITCRYISAHLLSN